MSLFASTSTTIGIAAVSLILPLIWLLIQRRGESKARSFDISDFGDRVFLPQRWYGWLGGVCFWGGSLGLFVCSIFRPDDWYRSTLLAGLVALLGALVLIDYFRSRVTIRGCTVSYQGFVRRFDFDIRDVRSAWFAQQFIVVDVGQPRRIVLPSVVRQAGLLLQMLNHYRPTIDQNASPASGGQK